MFTLVLEDGFLYGFLKNSDFCSQKLHFNFNLHCLFYSPNKLPPPVAAAKAPAAAIPPTTIELGSTPTQHLIFHLVVNSYSISQAAIYRLKVTHG
jgi:hypothetical protein